MIKKVQTKAKGWKIHTQLMVLILLTGLASILLFEVLWLNKWDIYEYVQQVPGFRDMSQDEDFWEKLRTEAANYNIPSSEDDKEGIKKFLLFNVINSLDYFLSIGLPGTGTTKPLISIFPKFKSFGV